MAAEDSLRALADLVAAQPRLEAAAAARPAAADDPPQARTLNPRGGAEEFFRSVVEQAVAPEWTLLAYDPLYKPDEGQLEWLSIDEVDALRLAADRYGSLSQFAPFDPDDEDYKRRLRYWVVTLGRGGRTAFFFRSFSATAELKRKKFAALVTRDGAFHAVEDHIFLFDSSIDCFVFDGYVYVIRKRDYRRIFDQLDEVRRRAKSAASELNERLPIANFEEFADACSKDSRMADKVLAVRQRDYFPTLTYDTLKPVIDEFKLEIETVTKDGQTQLVFSSDPRRRLRILKLVDDDYLRSSWTNHRYEVNSKTDAPGG